MGYGQSFRTIASARAFAAAARLWRDENGQAISEYLLLLSFCTATCALLARGVRQMLDQGVLRLGGQLEKDLRTGRAPLNVWVN